MRRRRPRRRCSGHAGRTSRGAAPARRSRRRGASGRRCTRDRLARRSGSPRWGVRLTAGGCRGRRPRGDRVSCQRASAAANFGGRPAGHEGAFDKGGGAVARGFKFFLECLARPGRRWRWHDPTGGARRGNARRGRRRDLRRRRDRRGRRCASEQALQLGLDRLVRCSAGGAAGVAPASRLCSLALIASCGVWPAARLRTISIQRAWLNRAMASASLSVSRQPTATTPTGRISVPTFVSTWP